jgi:hypothetical protein
MSIFVCYSHGGAYRLILKNMKSKFYLILVIFVFTTCGLFAQNQETLAKFVITDASDNGNDITPHILKEGAYIVFYTSDNDGLIYMANCWPKSNSQSFGPMYSVENEKKRETYDTYEADFFYFNWRYNNSYDSKKGTAKVQLIKIYKPQGVAFIVKIIPENLDILIYKGYMEGSINFSDYLN